MVESNKPRCLFTCCAFQFDGQCLNPSGEYCVHQEDYNAANESAKIKSVSRDRKDDRITKLEKENKQLKEENQKLLKAINEISGVLNLLKEGKAK